MLAEDLLRAIRESVAWFPLSGRTAIEVTGRDRATFLHNFCTNDIKKLQPGQGCEAFFCNAKGRVIGHGNIVATEDALWIDSVPGQSAKLMAHLDRYIIREDVTLRDRSSDFGTLCGLGPQASLLTGLASEPVRCSSWMWHDGPCTYYVGTTTWLAKILDDLPIQSSPHGTADDFEALRIAAGWPHFGIDITEDNLPQEVARTAQAISFTKGCYLGQEPIARLDALGHTNRELRRLAIASEALPEAGTELQDQTTDDIVGQITSAAPAPFGPGVVTLGYLKTKWTKPGTIVKLGTLPGQTATVQPL